MFHLLMMTVCHLGMCNAF